jgi:RimJ/RimL family protein N-acetyltransferase
MPAHRRGFTFRPLAASDLELLQRWLNTPHVLEWWDRPGPTLDEVRAKYLPRVTGQSDAMPYVICVDDVPIGYIQSYPVRAGAWGLPEVRAGAGLDLFIGDVHCLHRGLGPQILRQFVEEIVFRDKTVTACYIDPVPQNHSAIRAFEKAGFAYVGAATDPDSGLAVHLMQITRGAA